MCFLRFKVTLNFKVIERLYMVFELEMQREKLQESFDTNEIFIQSTILK